jgi:hypothetical protein
MVADAPPPRLMEDDARSSVRMQVSDPQRLKGSLRDHGRIDTVTKLSYRMPLGGRHANRGG